MDNKISFIADMNISPIVVENLKNNGYIIERVSNLLNPKAKDIEILYFAKKNDKIIITCDLDFINLLALNHYDKPSVITLRLDNSTPYAVTNKLLQIIPVLEKDLQTGIIASVDEKTIRFKNLPIDKNIQ